MAVVYEFVCRSCGETVQFSRVEKEAGCGDRPCGCGGSLRRVWGSSVQTVTIPGFFASDNKR